jgi:hypothetical protein
VLADTPETFTVWFNVTCPTAVLADTPLRDTTVPGVAAPRAVVIETLGHETVIPELIDAEPTLDDMLRPLNATVTDPDTPCEEKAASANEEAAKVIRVYPSPLLLLSM